MTISSNSRKAGPFIGNGTAATFPFTFKVFQASDLEVVKLTVATNVETILVLNTDFTASVNEDQNSNPGGSITLTAGALASGYNLVITSDIQNLQPTDLTNQGGFYPEVITDALDRATIQIQQLQEAVDRSAKLPITSSSDADSLVADIVRLADSADNIDAVANDIANIDNVSDDIANVNIVATNISNVNTVAGVSANVTTVATDIAAVNTVAADLNEPVSEIETVAGSITNVNTVGNNIANVNTVAGINANVTTVAGISANVSTVATNNASVVTVATDIAAVQTVANDLNEPVSEIETVAGSIANVNTVGTNIASVNTVAGISADVTTVSGISADVTSVAAIDADVSAVAAIDSDVSTVAGISSDVTTVATNVTDITNFSDVYLGPHASNPITRNDSSPLQAGDLYFNTSADEMRVYTGSLWQTLPTTPDLVQKTSFTATAGQTTYFWASGYKVGYLFVYVDGLLLADSAFVATDGSNITFNTPLSLNDNVQLVSYTSVNALTLGDVVSLFGGVNPKTYAYFLRS